VHEALHRPCKLSKMLNGFEVSFAIPPEAGRSFGWSLQREAADAIEARDMGSLLGGCQSHEIQLNVSAAASIRYGMTKRITEVLKKRKQSTKGAKAGFHLPCPYPSRWKERANLTQSAPPNVPAVRQHRKGLIHWTTDSMKPHNCIFDFPSHGCGRFKHPYDSNFGNARLGVMRHESDLALAMQHVARAKQIVAKERALGSWMPDAQPSTPSKRRRSLVRSGYLRITSACFAGSCANRHREARPSLPFSHRVSRGSLREASRLCTASVAKFCAGKTAAEEAVGLQQSKK
jgi:hypothetical protein